MMNIAFLHTSSVHIDTFDQLLRPVDSKIDVQHIVDEPLLFDARQNGLSADIHERVGAHVFSIWDGVELIVCTCSTLGDVAESIGRDNNWEIMRVDRPMAEAAARIGGRVVVLATLESTLAPTWALIDAALARGDSDNPSEIDLILCADAWSHFEGGDVAAYHHSIAEQIRHQAAVADVIVLAQASMAGAKQLCPAISVPILDSPTSFLSWLQGQLF